MAIVTPFMIKVAKRMAELADKIVPRPGHDVDPIASAHPAPADNEFLMEAAREMAEAAKRLAGPLAQGDTSKSLDDEDKNKEEGLSPAKDEQTTEVAEGKERKRSLPSLRRCSGLLVSHEPEASTVSQPVSGDVLVEFLKDLEIFKSLYSICPPGSAQEQLCVDLLYLLVLARYSVKPNEETPSLLLKLNDFISVIRDQVGQQPQPLGSAAGAAAMDEDAASPTSPATPHSSS